MAEEVPADFGQAHSSYVSTMGGNGGVGDGVHAENRILSGRE